MAQQSVQYDDIGNKYDAYARTAALKKAERYSFLRMVGKVAGLRVLDLACGFGFYTRLLKRGGAAAVVGVDISPEMIRLARRQEEAQPLGVTYQVGDGATLPALGSFDLVTAVHLLTYAKTKAELLAMFHSAFANLATDGRFVVCTNNPAFTLEKPNCTQYGMSVLSLEPEEDRYACEAEFHADPPFRVRWNQWRQEPYEWALREAGFRDFAWHPAEVAPEDIGHYGEPFWRDFYDNCPIIGLICGR